RPGHGRIGVSGRGSGGAGDRDPRSVGRPRGVGGPCGVGDPRSIGGPCGVGDARGSGHAREAAVTATAGTLTPGIVAPEERRVLVVDDEADLLEIVADRLRGAGYRVLTARDGLEALERASALRPQCIVLDLKMPR